ncbi:SDH family Clp fold serine proteinase [Petropleomorpha daqingensis]|uniref:Serine dehydrogenase proteinase n=1 Tax=Petropleomorpha daqingensis TaxID=2026353 RepID=A0A853CDB8_9ACTN|nr:hypothetical protein [Petropleomorpha daqingensis]
MVIGPFTDAFPTYFEELVHDANPDEDLHLLLDSPGGSADVALRLLRSAQARCRELTVIVPDQAKSAATLICLGAHQLLLGPTSDLGPVDPQFQAADGSLISAKNIIAAWDSALEYVRGEAAASSLVEHMLRGYDLLDVQTAKSALNDTERQMRTALAACSGRDAAQVDELFRNLVGPLKDAPDSHAAVFTAEEAQACGLPVTFATAGDRRWSYAWQLWARYFELEAFVVFEGRIASQVIPRAPSFSQDDDS